MEYINIDKNLIPYKFDIKLAGETYTFEIRYNELYDFFSIDLYKNQEPIVLGEKIVYGKPLFATCLHKDIPKVSILPYDISLHFDDLTFKNLGEQVFLYLVEDDEDGII